jgi:uncharacterized protein (DUF3084 family)
MSLNAPRTPSYTVAKTVRLLVMFVLLDTFTDSCTLLAKRSDLLVSASSMRASMSGGVA